MVVIVPGPLPLDTKSLSCWSANDEVLGIFVVFIGRSTTTNVTQSSSRIQSHVFSIAGLQSFPRLTINPSSALYEAVNHLPSDDQGDETRRGIAISLLKYFTEMPKAVLSLLKEKAERSPIYLFGATHAALLASQMKMVKNSEEIANQITMGMAERALSWLDVDVILPKGSTCLIRPPPTEGRASLVPLPDLRPEIDYGSYNTLVELLGEVAFLPTTRIRRAPSRPTAVSRTRVLDKDKEDGLRREIQELFATEKSYVSRLNELEESIAANYVRSIGDGNTTLSVSDQAMKTLFPGSLTRILALHEHFLSAMEQIVDLASKNASSHLRTVRDPTGALAFSKAMLEYFPYFKEPYQSYLKNSSQHSQIFVDLLKDKNTPWANAITASGEQRLKSWLIEPVQRLPRYSLFIDNMANLLPADHPAMSRFLRARDIITEICALESDEPINSQRVIEKLQQLVLNWPKTFNPEGRLVTAIDAIQLSPPYYPDPFGKNGEQFVILLFSDQLIFLEKTGTMSSRGVLAELDRSITTTTNDHTAIKSFTLSRSIQLANARFLESQEGKLFHVDGSALVFEPSDNSSASVYEASDVFQLLGSYDGKAGRFSEEISLALIEGRFPEKMREDDMWMLRSINPASSAGLGLITTVYEVGDLERLTAQNVQFGKARLVVDKGTEKLRDAKGRHVDATIEILVKLMVIGNDKFNVEVLSYGRQVSVDACGAEELVNLLVKRLSYVLRIHSKPFNEDTAYAAIGLAREIALCIQPRLDCEEQAAVQDTPDVTTTGSRRFRPFSPVKGLSNILHSNSGYTTSPSKTLSSLRRGNSSKAIPASHVFGSQETSGQSDNEQPPPNRFNVQEGMKSSGIDLTDPLERTFDTYIVALQTRKGNIVGRILHNRATADELAVNELYNTLIQRPGEYQAAAEVPVDVLFAAFEKFLKVAWRERAGAVILPATLHEMQTLLFSDVPGMVQQFKTIMSDVSRQNQRIFRSLIGVLAELVGATSNDGDRGALIMTFADLLVIEGDPIEYIMLLDRLLADADILLGVQPPNPTSDGVDRAKAANTGSVGSTTSSIGKKLGFFSGLSRGNSKASESESRVAQVLRQLSKRSNAATESTPPSISRSFLSRGRSADSRPTTPGSSVPSRPESTYSGQSSPRPGSSHGYLRHQMLGNGGKMGPPVVPTRKKRRSSLSDLTDLKPVESPYLESTSEASRTQRPVALSKTPSTSSVMNRGRPNFHSEIQPLNLHERPSSRTALAGDRSPIRNTASPTPSGASAVLLDAPHLSVERMPNLSPTKVQSSFSHRLKIQSPQKLRERLDREKQAMADIGPELQAELAGIGRELASVKVSSTQHQQQERQLDLNSTLDRLSSRVATIEHTLRIQLDDLGQRTDDIQRDYESSLTVSEKKARSLDDLYREANAENELLYDRFNEELAKVMKAVRGSGGGGSTGSSSESGVQEMKRLLQEAQDEAARLRKENQRLKRENLGLRSQLRDS